MVVLLCRWNILEVLYANCRAIHAVHRLCWYERLRSTPELETTQSSRRLLSSLTPTANLG